MFKWWKLIWLLSTTYGVRVFFIYFKSERGAMVSNRITSERLYILCPIWPTKKTFLIFVHELGHYLHPNGTHSTPLIAELAAWEEAFKILYTMRDSVGISHKEYSFMRYSFSTYVIHYSKDDFISVMRAFDTLFQKHYVEGVK